MKYLQSILENESVRSTVQSADELTTLALETIIPLQVEGNIDLIHENLDVFVTEDIDESFEDIVDFSQEDSLELTSALSELMAESSLTLEDKEHIIVESIEDYLEERRVSSKKTTSKVAAKLFKRTGNAESSRKVGKEFKSKVSNFEKTVMGLDPTKARRDSEKLQKNKIEKTATKRKSRVKFLKGGSKAASLIGKSKIATGIVRRGNLKGVGKQIAQGIRRKVGAKLKTSKVDSITGKTKGSEKQMKKQMKKQGKQFGKQFLATLKNQKGPEPEST